jgi:hypothetical protein
MMSSEHSLLVMCLYFNVLTWFLVVLIFQLMGLDSVGARTASFGLGQAWRKRRQKEENRIAWCFGFRVVYEHRYEGRRPRSA